MLEPPSIVSVFEDTGLRGMKIEHNRLSLVSYYAAALSEELFQMSQAGLGGLAFIMATPDQLDRRKGKESWDWISENVDVIVVLRKGEIEETGSFSELSKREGYLSALLTTSAVS